MACCVCGGAGGLPFTQNCHHECMGDTIWRSFPGHIFHQIWGAFHALIPPSNKTSQKNVLGYRLYLVKNSQSNLVWTYFYRYVSPLLAQHTHPMWYLSFITPKQNNSEFTQNWTKIVCEIASLLPCGSNSFYFGQTKYADPRQIPSVVLISPVRQNFLNENWNMNIMHYYP